MPAGGPLHRQERAGRLLGTGIPGKRQTWPRPSRSVRGDKQRNHNDNEDGEGQRPPGDLATQKAGERQGRVRVWGWAAGPRGGEGSLRGDARVSGNGSAGQEVQGQASHPRHCVTDAASRIQEATTCGTGTRAASS